MISMAQIAFVRIDLQIHYNLPIWQKVPSYPVLQSHRNSFWRSAQVPSFTHGLEAHSLMSSPQVVPEKPGLHKQWVPPPSNSLHSPFPWHVCPVHSGISILKKKKQCVKRTKGSMWFRVSMHLDYHGGVWWWFPINTVISLTNSYWHIELLKIQKKAV